MLRTALLWGNTITLDADLSKYIETVSDQWVIEGLEVSSNSVAPGKAWVKATRSNGETIMTLVQNTEALAVDTSGTKKIWLEIRQEAIDNGLLNNEDWTWIAEIKTWPTLPSQNFLLLATVADWVAKDERNLIPKIQSIAQKTSVLEEKMTTAEGQINQLVEAGTPSYLGITGIVGEKYTMNDSLFLQKTPTLEDSVIAINVGDIAANKEQHIQRISNGQSDNKIKLKVDKFWLPTTNVIVEIRKWIKVDVNEKEAYRYGGNELLASASLPYTTFQTEAQEITVNLNQAFQLPKWELYSIVVKQENGIVNASNYYRLYYNNTQYSEAFSVVAVNGSSRVRSRLMPYCVSDGFESELLVKFTLEKNVITVPFQTQLINTDITYNRPININIPIPGRYTINYENASDADRSTPVGILIYWPWWDVFSKWGLLGNGSLSVTFESVWTYTIDLQWSSRRRITIVSLVPTNLWLYKKAKTKLSPRWTYWIWEKWDATMFGLNIDWSFLGREIDVAISNTATTWSIPPINAVGYMSIIGADWKKYKIRVYWE